MDLDLPRKTKELTSYVPFHEMQDKKAWVISGLSKLTWV